MPYSFLLPLLMLLPILASPLCFPLRRGGKKTLFIGFILLSLAETGLAFLPVLFPHLITGAPAADLSFGSVLGLHFTYDSFRGLYTALAAFLFGMAALFSPRYFSHGENQCRYCFFNLLTYGATVGVFLSADLLTCFCCFELLSFCSAVWVVHEQTTAAVSAARTYLAVSVLGGLCLFLGMGYLYSLTGTLRFSELPAALAGCEARGLLFAAGLLMLLGFGAKAGMFPLHIWLPKAHPVAPAPSSALLSGMLTKVGVYGVLTVCGSCFLGNEKMGRLLLFLAAVTMLLGTLLALLSGDLKRILACSSMSQIGFILSGIGSFVLLGEDAAATGTVLHMLNHSCIKLVLFLCAGAVFENTHTLRLCELRGWGRRKPFLLLCFLLGGLDIAGIPGFGGYLSKTLLHEALAEAGKHLGGGALAYEWVFLLSGGLTLAYMTKLFICLFVEKHPEKQREYDAQKQYLSAGQRLALAAAVAALLPTGIPSLSLPLAGEAGKILSPAASPFAGNLFGMESLAGIFISVGIGAAVYLAVVLPFLRRGGRYPEGLPVWCSLEEKVYLPIIRGLSLAGKYLALCFDAPMQRLDRITRFLCRVGRWIASLPDELGEHMGEIVGFCSAVGCFLARTADRFVDNYVILLRETVLRELPVKGKAHLGSSFTDALGQAEDALTGHAGHIPRLAKRRARILDAIRQNAGSYYFAMAAACVGILIILAAMLIAWM